MKYRFLLLAFASLLLTGNCGVLNVDETAAADDASKEGWAVCLESDVDAFVDKILVEARKSIPEPMRLPPRLTFVSLSEGRLWGLASLFRFGPMKVECKDNNRTVVVTGKLATDEIKARYKWEKKIRSTTHSGFVLVVSNDFMADMRIVIHKDRGSHPQLEKFKIERFKNVRVEMTGMGVLSWALGEITTMMSGVLQWAIAKSIQGPLQEAIERELWEVTIT